MIRIGKPWEGTLERGAPLDQQLSLGAGRCHRLIGVTDQRSADLSLRLFDSDDVIMLEDSAQGPVAILGSDEPICPQEPALARIRIRIVGAAGRYRIEHIASKG